VDASLVVLGSCLLLFAGLVAGVGRTYRPEWAQLPPEQPPAFRVAAKSVGGTGVLLIGGGALGVGGLLLAAIALVVIGSSGD
jgi:hypothetical protein